jgi:hypothetical protein
VGLVVVVYHRAGVVFSITGFTAVAERKNDFVQFEK